MPKCFTTTAGLVLATILATACVIEPNPDDPTGGEEGPEFPTFVAIPLPDEIEACSFHSTYATNTIDQKPVVLDDPDFDRYALTDVCRAELWPSLRDSVYIEGIDAADLDDALVVENLMRGFHTLVYRPTFTPRRCTDCETAEPLLFHVSNVELPISSWLRDSLDPVPETYTFELTPTTFNDELRVRFLESVRVITQHTDGTAIARYTRCGTLSDYCAEGDGILSVHHTLFGDPNRSALELAGVLVHEASHAVMPHHIGDGQTDPDTCSADLEVSLPGNTRDCNIEESAYWAEFSYLQAATIGGLVSTYPGGALIQKSHIEADDVTAGWRLQAACEDAFTQIVQVQSDLARVSNCTAASDHVLHPLFSTNPFWPTVCTVEPYDGPDPFEADACCGTSDYSCNAP
ncbi:MAG: hypothetical protein KTR31_32755 [Myxococcales bacterium]|nr:hypothetical protein [Myxococcales bacterium]